MRAALLTSILLLAFGCSGGKVASGKLSFESYQEKGKLVTLESLRGKVVLLDFWATWCGPCREFFPFVQQVHDDYASKGVQVVAITDENRGTIESFKKTNPTNYPLFMDSDRSMSMAFEINQLPTMVVLGKSGETLFHGHPSEREEIIRAIESGLGG